MKGNTREIVILQSHFALAVIGQPPHAKAEGVG